MSNLFYSILFYSKHHCASRNLTPLIFFLGITVCEQSLVCRPLLHAAQANVLCNADMWDGSCFLCPPFTALWWNLAPDIVPAKVRSTRPTALLFYTLAAIEKSYFFLMVTQSRKRPATFGHVIYPTINLHTEVLNLTFFCSPSFSEVHRSWQTWWVSDNT